MFDETIYQFQIKVNEEVHECTSYADFLHRIRRIEAPTFDVKISIIGRCDSPWMTLDSSGLYLVNAQRINFPGVYSESDVTLSFESLISAVKVIASKVEEPQHVNYTLPEPASKILAFFISEAARFEIVEHAVYVMFNDQSTQYSWKSWKPLLNNWSNLSRNASVHYTYTLTDEKQQVRPVPISSSQENIYEPERAAVHHGTILSKLHRDVESKYLKLEFFMPDDSSDNANNGMKL